MKSSKLLMVCLNNHIKRLTAAQTRSYYASYLNLDYASTLSCLKLWMAVHYGIDYYDRLFRNTCSRTEYDPLRKCEAGLLDAVKPSGSTKVLFAHTTNPPNFNHINL